MPEPSRIAGVMPTRRSSTAAMSHSHWPNTCVKVCLGGVAGFWMPTLGSNGVGPSAPTMPARSSANTTGRFCSATSWIIWS